MTPNEIQSLEQHLLAAGSAMRYPPTPDLAGGFWKRLGEAPARRAVRRLFWAGAVVAPIIMLVVAIASIAPVRDAAADLVDRINIFQTEQSTKGLPTDIPGKVVTLDQAQTAIGKQIPQPTAPQGLVLKKVLLQGYGEVQVAALFYESDEQSLVLFASNAFVAKGIPIGSLAHSEAVSGVGDQAFWITGERIVYSVRRDGGFVIGSERVTDANALIWDQDGFLYRIEGNLDKDTAIEIAKSLR